MSNKIVEELKNIIIDELGENYNPKDEKILKNILSRSISKAMSISNRKGNDSDICILEDEIITYTKAIYLQRGVEDVKSLSTSGKGSSFIDADEKLRNSIIKNCKRIIR